MFLKGQKVSLDFYKISFKPTFSGHIKYGQEYYDFEEAGLVFLRPKTDRFFTRGSGKL